MARPRWDRFNGWHIESSTSRKGAWRKGVWGYRTPWGAWHGWRRLNEGGSHA